jgi:hypothetical protein
VSRPAQSSAQSRRRPMCSPDRREFDRRTPFSVPRSKSALAARAVCVMPVPPATRSSAHTPRADRFRSIVCHRRARSVSFRGRRVPVSAGIFGWMTSGSRRPRFSSPGSANPGITLSISYERAVDERASRSGGRSRGGRRRWLVNPSRWPHSVLSGEHVGLVRRKLSRGGGEMDRKPR